MKARLLRAGDRALLIEVGTVEEVLALTAALRAADLPEVTELVPAARTVLVHTDADLRSATGERLTAGLTALAEAAEPSTAVDADENVVTIPVRYDGPDLDEVASATGLDPAQIIELHTGSPWRAAFVGFAPGFAYLTGGPVSLRVPRRQQSRPSVPAGSVALAGEYSAVYPGVSPGGWQLIGRTELNLWDLSREPPGLISPGTRVRFVDAASAAGDRGTP